MPAEVRTFAALIPAGTPIATPVTVALTMPAREVRHVRVRIPPGPNGQVGFAVGMAGVSVLPVNVGQWIIGNDEVIDWDVAGLPDSGAWQLIGYNLGVQPHTIYVTFSVDPPGRRGLALPVAPLAVTA